MDNRTPESDRPGCESWCCHLPAVWLGRAHLPGLGVHRAESITHCPVPAHQLYLQNILCRPSTQPGGCPDSFWPCYHPDQVVLFARPQPARSSSCVCPPPTPLSEPLRAASPSRSPLIPPPTPGEFSVVSTDSIKSMSNPLSPVPPFGAPESSSSSRKFSLEIRPHVC